MSTGLSATNSNVASLSTSTSTAINSLSTGLSTTNSNVNSLSTSTSTGIGSLSTGLSTTNSNVASLSTGVTNINNTLNSLSTTINNNTIRANNNNGVAADLNGKGNDLPVGAGSNDGGRSNVVSVGSDQQQRQITNVAPGTQGTDAVNVNQLTQVQTTLSTALSGQQAQINSLGSQLQQTDQMAKQGIAAVGAMASIPQLDRDANFGMGVGTSTFLGQKAMAVNMQARITETLKASINGGFSGGQKVIGAGMLYQWK